MSLSNAMIEMLFEATFIFCYSIDNEFLNIGVVLPTENGKQMEASHECGVDERLVQFIALYDGLVTLV